MTSLGSVFPDYIISENKRKHSNYHSGNNQEFGTGNRLLFFILILIFGLGILTARLFSLTIVQGSYYRHASIDNRIRETSIAAARGIIYDRNGIPLVRNIPTFTLPDGTVIFENRPGTDRNYKESVTREYIYGDTTGHLLGYTSEIDKQELDLQSLTAPAIPIAGGVQTTYKAGDIVGKAGIERSYDRILRGTDGKEMHEVDAFGTTVRTLGRQEPQVGQNLSLAIDLELQKTAQSALADVKGAAIVSDPRTGEIMVLYSSPSYNPNSFVRSEQVDTLLSDSRQPLFNRAVGGLYPPGSTFKLITASAALENGVITPSTEIEDTGVLVVGPYSFGNWYFLQYGRKEGYINIVTALKRSNDIFFYKAGELTGIDSLAKWARKFGIGTQLGIDIAGEAAGLMPDPAWQKKAKDEQWYLGNTYHVAIGQGDILVTPLQINSVTNTIANSGKECQPHLIKQGKAVCKDIGLKTETIQLIKEGMKEACAPGGTGYPLFDFKVKNPGLSIDGTDFVKAPVSTQSSEQYVGVSLACKTGTAEFGDPNNRTHAWFTAFAPVGHPQISVTVLVEGGGEGSSVAAPVAKRILENWFGR